MREEPRAKCMLPRLFKVTRKSQMKMFSVYIYVCLAGLAHNALSAGGLMLKPSRQTGSGTIECFI